MDYTAINNKRCTREYIRFDLCNSKTIKENNGSYARALNNKRLNIYYKGGQRFCYLQKQKQNQKTTKQKTQTNILFKKYYTG